MMQNISSAVKSMWNKNPIYSSMGVSRASITYLAFYLQQLRVRPPLGARALWSLALGGVLLLGAYFHRKWKLLKECSCFREKRKNFMKRRTFL